VDVFSDSAVLSLVLQGTRMHAPSLKNRLHALVCNTCLWLGQHFYADSLAILRALTYGMLWVNHSASEDLRGRGEEKHICWFWLEHVVFLCLLWTVCRTNHSLLFPYSVAVLNQKGVSCQPLSVQYTYLLDC